MTSRKPVFIHVSKNAGTSIAESAGDHCVNAGHREHYDRESRDVVASYFARDLDAFGYGF